MSRFGFYGVLLSILYVFFGGSDNASRWKTATFVNGWSDRGHMTITAVAYLDLSEDQRSFLSSALELWEDEYKGLSNPITSSVWPDHIKCHSDMICCRGLNRYDDISLFSHWHFVNCVHNPGGIPLKPIYELMPLPESGALWALKRMLASLRPILGDDDSDFLGLDQSSTSSSSSSSSSSFYHSNPYLHPRELLSVDSAMDCPPLPPPAALISPVLAQQRVVVESPAGSLERPNRHDTGRKSTSLGTPFSLNFQLRFLLHLMGDIHQPLHCVSRFTTAFPHGDQGGERQRVHSHPNFYNLHQLWDGEAIRTSESSVWPYFTVEDAIARAKELRIKYPREAFGDRLKGRYDGLDLDAIVEDSYRIAAEHAYSELPPDSPDEIYYPSECYMRAVREITEQQVVLGGYRLCRLLQKLLRKQIKSQKEDYTNPEE